MQKPFCYETPKCYKQTELTLMSGSIGEGGNISVRAGTHALSLLSVPTNVHVLKALAAGPKSLVDLRKAAGSPPQTTMRGHLKALTEIGVLERKQQNGFPGNLDFELAPAGKELLGVAGILDYWLASAPDGPLPPGSTAAKSSIKALIEGWSTSIVRALAARPFSLTELDSLITSISYPSLERRLGAMRLAGQIEPCRTNGRGTPYVATEWLRRAIAPLAAAARWEGRHVPEETAPINRHDIEAAFLLAVPMLSPPPNLTGTCRLAVEVQSSGEHRLAGVLVDIEQGRVRSCASRLKGDAGAWVVGPAHAWLTGVIERDANQLEIGGDCALAETLLDGLHGALFGSGQKR